MEVESYPDLKYKIQKIFSNLEQTHPLKNVSKLLYSYGITEFKTITTFQTKLPNISSVDIDAMTEQTNKAIETRQDNLKRLPKEITLGEFTQDITQILEINQKGLTALVAVMEKRTYKDVMVSENYSAGLKGTRKNSKLVSSFPTLSGSGGPTWMKSTQVYKDVAVIDYDPKERFHKGNWTVKRNLLSSSQQPSIDIKTSQQLASFGYPVPVGVLGHSDYRGKVTILTDLIKPETITYQETIFPDGERIRSDTIIFKDFLLLNRNKGNENDLKFTTVATLKSSDDSMKITLTRMANTDDIQVKVNNSIEDEILARLSK